MKEDISYLRAMNIINKRKERRSKMRAVYYVEYKMYEADEVKGIDVIANNKEDAYDIATFLEIPRSEKSMPYSSWVSGVTYNNGKHHRFNTFEGKPY